MISNGILRSATVLFLVVLTPLTAAAADHHGTFAPHYKNSLFKVTETGRYSVELLVKERRLRAGDNTLELIVHDGKNRDVVGADVTIVPRMAGMHHGVSAKAVVSEQGGGLYRAENVVLSAGGHWELKVTVKKDSVADAAVFVFADVPAGHGEHAHHGHASPHAGSGHMHKQVKTSAIDTSTLRQTTNFRVAYASDAAPLPINTLHSWRLKVTTPQGKPVKGAAITVTGDMPAHGHGLPTEPEVTREIADGVYLVEGLKFNMPGHWVMQFNIEANGKRDTAAFDLVIR